MGNVVNFQKPNGNKKDNLFAIKTIVVTLLLLFFMKVFGLTDGRPLIYQKHQVSKISQLEVPKDYMVIGMDGKSQKISDLFGENLTILAFWATWCGYCADEFPHLGDVAPELEKKGINIIPIARGDETPEKIQQFFERLNIKNIEPVIASSHSLYKALGVSSYPSFVVLDENGIAIAKIRPQWQDADLQEMFGKLIGK